VLNVSSRSIKEMDQVGANLSKQDPGHPAKPNRGKVTRHQVAMHLIYTSRLRGHRLRMKGAGPEIFSNRALGLQGSWIEDDDSKRTEIRLMTMNGRG